MVRKRAGWVCGHIGQIEEGKRTIESLTAYIIAVKRLSPQGHHDWKLSKSPTTLKVQQQSWVIQSRLGLYQCCALVKSCSLVYYDALMEWEGKCSRWHKGATGMGCMTSFFSEERVVSQWHHFLQLLLYDHSVAHRFIDEHTNRASTFPKI